MLNPEITCKWAILNGYVPFPEGKWRIIAIRKGKWRIIAIRTCHIAISGLLEAPFWGSR